jgi:hypothetical protein
MKYTLLESRRLSGSENFIIIDAGDIINKKDSDKKNAFISKNEDSLSSCSVSYQKLDHINCFIS